MMRRLGIAFVLACLLALPAVAAEKGAHSKAPRPEEVIAQFQEQEEPGVLPIPLKRKREIMFWMGLALLVFVLATVSLGVAMAVFGKDVFLWHMIFGGLTALLAIVHAATAIAWFWPY